MIVRGNKGVYFGNLDKVLFTSNTRGDINFYSAESTDYPVLVHHALTEKEAEILIDKFLERVLSDSVNLIKFDFREAEK